MKESLTPEQKTPTCEGFRGQPCGKPVPEYRAEYWSQDDIDDEGVCPDCDQIWDMCECRAGEECGRWNNGKLTKSCSKAGSEECDFECPYRGSLYG